MTEEQAVLEIIVQHIKKLPFDKQLFIADAAKQVREILSEYDKDEADMAIVLLSAQLAAEPD